MTIKDTYFFDTYAIIEIIGGNMKYKPYTLAGIVVTKLNLFELLYAITRLYNKEVATEYLNKYKQFAMDFDENDIESAVEVKNSNKKLSMTDCIGYVVALRNNIKFLTGDR